MISRANNIVDIPDIKIPGINEYQNESDWDIILSQYLARISTPAQNDPSPLSGGTINDFFELVKNAISSRETSEGVPEDHRLLFVEEEPPEELDTEAITFEIARRRPGSFSQGPAGKGSIKEVTPHFRAQIDSEDRPGEKLITMGKRYDNWIIFYCYARTNKQARKRMLWFESVMNSFNWYFKLFGYIFVIYEGTDQRESIRLGELKLVRYPITYIVQTDDTFHISRQELRNLVIKTEISQSKL